jgi:UDP-N-acetyl-2-amino-2-deoxyglucuronate dehydrogenase
MKNFIMIGVGGFIAPRHLKAIKETGNNLLAALDKHDSVGIMDSHFPNADFFVEYERFDRHIDKLKRNGTKIDFLTVCSPNYLHDSHIRFGLRQGLDVICEKPLVLNPWNVDALAEIEKETGKKVYTILQLRLHPSIIALREKVLANPGKIYDVDLTYITSRGKWYFISWKGNDEKSGGVTTNIGIHFFDMLMWVFGSVKKSELHISEPVKASGYIELERARIKWFLSVDFKDLPKSALEKGMTTFRSLKIEEDQIEFSDGFKDLHTLSYENILAGNGFGLREARASINLAHDIRNARITKNSDMHPFAKL